jgi:predicted hotdog family 3-hydroxylacyl-ACP dehydratase
MTLRSPATLAHAGIALRIPHQGRMCLLDRLQRWSDSHVFCTALSHHDADNPLRSASGLLAAPCAIEYAAQAMALHGVLTAPASAAPMLGYLASVRGVRLAALRLDERPGALQVHAERLAGNGNVAAYQFGVFAADGTVLVDGHATVVLNPIAPTDRTAA